MKFSSGDALATERLVGSARHAPFVGSVERLKVNNLRLVAAAPYSLRRASTGFIRVARRAGTTHAAKPITASPATPVTRTQGSSTVMPVSKVVSTLLVATVRASPAIKPAPTAV